MYRQYEEPSHLYKLLEEAEADYESAVNRNADVEELIDLHEWIESLKERINFAWQDIEYEENERSYSEFLGEC